MHVFIDKIGIIRIFKDISSILILLVESFLYIIPIAAEEHTFSCSFRVLSFPCWYGRTPNKCRAINSGVENLWRYIVVNYFVYEGRRSLSWLCTPEEYIRVVRFNFEHPVINNHSFSILCVRLRLLAELMFVSYRCACPIINKLIVSFQTKRFID